MRFPILVSFSFVVLIARNSYSNIISNIETAILDTIGGQECDAKDVVIENNQDLYMYDENSQLIKVDYKGKPAESEKHIKKKVYYYLYTEIDQTEPESLILNDTNALKNSKFDANNPTVFMTHGFSTSAKGPACIMIKDAYLTRGHYNVILVDWSMYADKNYLTAISKVQKVSSTLAAMIDFLENNGMNLANTSVIGHSLGAHMVGLAAYKAQNVVNHVVGLDPAMPGFITDDQEKRISRKSGRFVEIIHTNGGLLGFLEPIGDHDFYPNGGVVQPGCGIDFFYACSHARAYEYYAEAIRNVLPFYGKKCQSFDCFKKDACDNEVAIMGNPMENSNITGKFYFITKIKSPFSLGTCGYDMNQLLMGCKYIY